MREGFYAAGGAPLSPVTSGSPVASASARRAMRVTRTVTATVADGSVCSFDESLMTATTRQLDGDENVVVYAHAEGTCELTVSSADDTMSAELSFDVLPEPDEPTDEDAGPAADAG